MPEKDKASVRETPRTSNKKNSSKRSQEKIKLGPALNVDTVINLSSENFEIGETASPNGEISDLEIARKLIKISQSAQDRKLSFNLTFDTMKNLVTSFYADLPTNARTAWNKLDIHYQQRNGFDDYLGFWSTIDSVSVLSVTPRDANSVVAKIRYVLRDGRVDTENRWLSVVDDNGQLLIYDSERIGPA